MLGLVHQFTFAQVSVTDKQGDKIVLMPDGTWKYADNNKQASVSNTVKAKLVYSNHLFLPQECLVLYLFLNLFP